LIKIISSADSGFQRDFNELLSRGKMDIAEVSSRVSELIDEVKRDGDSAVIRHIEMFDRWSPKSRTDLAVAPEDMKRAYDKLDSKLRDALHVAYERIEDYHKKLMPKSWFEYDKNGAMLGQMVTPVAKAGLYIPGGKAAYPSSLLMNAIPAIVAGVEDITVVTPTPDGEISELLLAACHLCRLDKVYKVGGATAIGAMAYGTESIKAVDVITGPGNIYVATAKKLVYGDVNIDMIAGPSEIGIIADESANPSWVAIDLLSQAEHDEMASSILITDSQKLADEVALEVEKMLKELDRFEIAKKSIDERGAIIVTKNLEEAVSLMNEIAPEHLEIMTSSPLELLNRVKNAGAVFLGHFTPEPIGDYIAGPNHTLPTGGTAKFYSPLSVEHFLKKSSLIMMNQATIDDIGSECAVLAEAEGLTAHEKSVRVRLKK
jgi:histidinol dehydrogenase